MRGKTTFGVRAALTLAIATGLLVQGGAAFADPVGGSSVASETDASADVTGAPGANAGSEGSEGTGGTDASDSGTIAAADGADAEDQASDSDEANADGTGGDAGTDAQGDAAADPGSEGDSADADASGADVDADAGAASMGEGGSEGGQDRDIDLEADSAADSDASSLSEEAIDESLGHERRFKSLAATSLASGFNAGYIISDQNFYNGGAMSTAQIQTFLNQKVGRCTLGDPGRAKGAAWGNTTLAWACLNGALWTTSNRASNAYCKAYAGGTQESSAAIISKVSRACGISPRVLLVMLEKEQSLVSDTWPTIRQFDFAMGYDCPDSGPNNSANCNSGAGGFPSQVYRAAWQFKVYKAFPTSYNYQAYRTNSILWHPDRACGTSPVYIENPATAGLYIYTPYRPNQAALNAGWGTGDACSSYGNRNFYQFYKQWFGSPNSAFPDVPPGSKFFTEIEWMEATGLTTGITTSDGRVIYAPKSSVTREAMAAFIYRLEGSPSFSAPKTSPFADLRPGDKFYKEITWMYARGYTTGIKQGTQRIYAPKDRVSREAMAAFIYRLQGGKYTGPAASPFADMQRGDKFYNEITWMYARGYTTGVNQSGVRVYAPKSAVTREAMAAFIYRLQH